ncbi:MAG: ABC transporter permease subunit [Clostridia bacterium]|nr:ABC transporter permease subunit [Clostridia bacterium]
MIALFWLSVWHIAAWRVGKPALLPTPWAVLVRLVELMQTAAFYKTTLTSLWNILLGILLAVLAGCVLSMLTACSAVARRLFFPVMSVIKATPVASFIILALIWIGSARVPTFITILIVLPVLWTNLDTGFTSMDPKLGEVAKVYRFSFWKRIRLLILPSLKPYFVSACRTSLGLAWKAGVAAEIIAMPRNTIGAMIGDAKQYIQTADMFAWTITVILLSLVIEFVFAALFDKATEKTGKKARVYAEH